MIASHSQNSELSTNNVYNHQTNVQGGRQFYDGKIEFEENLST